MARMRSVALPVLSIICLAVQARSVLAETCEQALTKADLTHEVETTLGGTIAVQDVKFFVSWNGGDMQPCSLSDDNQYVCGSRVYDDMHNFVKDDNGDWWRIEYEGVARVVPAETSCTPAGANTYLDYQIYRATGRVEKTPYTIELVRERRQRYFTKSPVFH